MFERFTDRARRMVVLAQEEARLLNHHYIGTEHILLGLVADGEGVAARALDALGIRLDVVRQQVEQIVGVGKDAPSGHIPFTPRAKKVLELSLREALQLGCNYIGTEHILLGLIREGDGVAAQVLKRLGVDLAAVRRQVTAMAPSGEQEVPEMARARSRVLPGGGAGILETLRDISERLARIEDHLGIRRPTGDVPPEAAGEAASGGDRESGPGTSDPGEPASEGEQEQA